MSWPSQPTKLAAATESRWCVARQVLLGFGGLASGGSSRLRGIAMTAGESRKRPRTATGDAGDRILAAERHSVRELAKLSFSSPPVHTVYSPLQYAWAVHEQYVRKFVPKAPVPILMLGMNPGPFGMAQTGVPFGQVAAVRDYMKLDPGLPIERPDREHPKRPIEGFACRRSEVSGQRLWGWAESRYGQEFFKHFYVHNYCPLAFVSATGANVVPERLPASQLQKVQQICDEALETVVSVLDPAVIVGVGEYAFKKGQALASSQERAIAKVLHPSPASPAANRGWANAADQQIADIIRKHSLAVPLPTAASE